MSDIKCKRDTDPWGLLKGIVLLTILLAGCARQPGLPVRIGSELVADGFASPVALADPRDGSGRLMVADQPGVIWIISGGRKLSEPFLDLRERIIDLNAFYDERGLLGLALHPDFAANGRVFVSYSAPARMGGSPERWDHTTYISEFRAPAGDDTRADPASEGVLLRIDKPGYNQEAGHLEFGPDGYLYIATGDSVHDPASEAGIFARDTNSLLGKILRIDVDHPGTDGGAYAIPPGNPFASGGGLPEIYAYGFRNPYRFSFDGSRLFAADVGQSVMEEVNLVEAGGDYGWPVREGDTCFNSQKWNQPLSECTTEGLADPIIAYAHAGDLSAVIGGSVYRGQQIPGLQGAYIFGDWGRGNGHLFAALPPGSGTGEWVVTELEVEMAGGGSPGQLLAVERDGEGELYLLVKDPGVGPTGSTGRVYKLVRE